MNIWSKITSIFNVGGATILGLCLAAIFVMTPQRAMAQTNVLDYELEFGTRDGYFHQPQGVAVDQQGYVYVTDVDDHRVQVFDPAGNFVEKWGWYGSDPGEFLQPVGIAVDDTRNRVYVAEMGNERIQALDRNGAFLFAFGSYGSGPGQFFDVHDVAIGAKGLYVADTWNHRIQIFDHNGNFLFMWGGQGSGPGQFDTPKAIAIYNNTVYVADSGNNRIQVFDYTGAFLWSFGTTGSGAGQFDTPSGIDVDANGIHVVDTGNDRMQRFDHAGVWQDTIGGNGSAPGLMDAPMGIAMHPDHKHLNFYVADSANHRVQRVDKYGNVLQILGSATAPDGHLTDPMGIVYSEKLKALYVADLGNRRIQVFDLDGQFLNGWTISGEPVDVATDPSDHDVWVVTLAGQVQRFRADGVLIASWSVPFGTGPGQIGTPKAIAVDGQQHVYIANQWFPGPGNTNGRIHIADASGNYLATWGAATLSQGNPPAPATFDLPNDIQLFGNDKSLYVAVEGQSRVKQVIMDGNLGIDSVLEYNAGTNRPAAVAAGPQEMLFVADGVGRLTVFSPFNNLIHQQDRVTGGGPGEFRHIGDMEYAGEDDSRPALLIFSEWENNRIQVFRVVGP